MTAQLSSLDGLSSEEVAKATMAGQCDLLLAGHTAAEIIAANARAEADEAVAEAAAAKAAVDQGARGGATNDGQVTAAELATMSPEAIAKATAEGRLRDLLS